MCDKLTQFYQRNTIHAKDYNDQKLSRYQGL